MEIINKEYPEFGFNVRYEILPDGKIDWEITNEGDEVVMMGKFSSKDFFQSTFTLLHNNVEENMYESLFYLYFENIKLECISLVEDKDVEDIEGEM